LRIDSFVGVLRTMRDIRDLSFEELREIVGSLQALVFLDIDPVGDFWNPDKDMDSDHLGELPNMLARYELAPQEALDLDGQPLSAERRSRLE
jgi:hypothetical protein